jgi:hypothetical protein
MSTKSLIFDENCDFSIFSNTSEITQVPGYLLTNMIEKVKAAPISQSILTIKVLKESSKDSGRRIENYSHKDIMISVAGMDDIFVTNEAGTVSIPIDKSMVDSKRRIYLWGVNNLDTEPFYTKHVTIPRSTVVEVTVIIPFRFDTENSEDNSNEQGCSFNGEEKETKVIHLNSGSTSATSSSIFVNGSQTSNQANDVTSGTSRSGRDFLDELERGWEADYPTEDTDDGSEETVGCAVPSRLGRIYGDLLDAIKTVEGGLAGGNVDDDDSLSMLKLYVYDIENLHDELISESSDPKSRANTPASLLLKLDDISANAIRVLNLSRKALQAAKYC